MVVAYGGVTISFIGDQMLFDFGSSSDQYCFPKNTVTWKVQKNKLLFLQGQTVLFAFTANDIDSPTGTVREVGASLQNSAQGGILQESRGLLSGLSTVDKFATRTLTSTAGEYDIFGGSDSVFTFLSSAEQITLVSDSTQDAGGQQGAIAVLVFGLDSNWNEQSETVIMTGIAAATSANFYLRVHEAYVGQAGTIGTNYGKITIASKTSTKTQLVIEKGQGITHSSFYTIPASKTGYLSFLEANTWADSSAKVDVYVMTYTAANSRSWKFSKQTLSDNNVFALGFPTSRAIPAQTDLYIRATTTRANTVVNVRYGLLIETE